MNRSRYIQIPVWRCGGDKELIEDIKKVLEDTNRYMIELDGNIMAIIEKPYIDSSKDVVTKITGTNTTKTINNKMEGVKDASKNK